MESNGIDMKADDNQVKDNKTVVKEEIDDMQVIGSEKDPLIPQPDNTGSDNTESKKTDFRDYYCQLRNQQNMLQDYIRSGIYRQAILSNVSDFKNKIVMDVGTGSGILAIFAAKAGAKKVYGIEASAVAQMAKKLVHHNGLSDIIEIIQSKSQNVTLPHKVDVIVSEPLGVFLVHERMLETYIDARDRFLKPGGLMFPTTSTLHLAPFTDLVLFQEQEARCSFWNSMFYDLDLSCLYSDARKEHFSQPIVGVFEPHQLLTAQTVTWELDFRTVTKEELYDIVIPFRMSIVRTEIMHGIACWFDCSFIGSTIPIYLNTSPLAACTHWQQCRLLLATPIAVNAGQFVTGTLTMKVNEYHSYDVKLDVELEGCGISTSMEYPLQNQLYRNVPTTTTVENQLILQQYQNSAFGIKETAQYQQNQVQQQPPQQQNHQPIPQQQYYQQHQLQQPQQQAQDQHQHQNQTHPQQQHNQQQQNQHHHQNHKPQEQQQQQKVMQTGGSNIVPGKDLK